MALTGVGWSTSRYCVSIPQMAVLGYLTSVLHHSCCFHPEHLYNRNCHLCWIDLYSSFVTRTKGTKRLEQISKSFPHIECVHLNFSVQRLKSYSFMHCTNYGLLYNPEGNFGGPNISICPRSTYFQLLEYNRIHFINTLTNNTSTWLGWLPRSRFNTVHFNSNKQLILIYKAI